MAYAQISNIAIQYDRNLNEYLKFYIPNTTTPILMATDPTGNTLIDKAQYNNNGFLTSDGSAIFIPYLDQSYDAWVFPSAAAADANDTSNAVKVAASVNPFADEFTITRNNVAVVEGQTTYPLSFSVSGDAVVIVNGSVLSQGSAPDGDYTIVPNGGSYDLILTNPLVTGDKLQVWSRTIAPAQAQSTLSQNIKYTTDVATTDLSDVSNFTTDNYDTVGDGGQADWAFTGVTDDAKAGTMDLANGKIYDANGREYIYSKRVLFDRAFGVKSSDQQNNIHVDATQALNNLFAFAKLRGERDKTVTKGGSNVFFYPRQELEKTGTLDLLNYEIPVDFNNCKIIQQDNTNDVINWEANNGGIKNLIISWADSITNEDIYNGKPAAIRISGGQPIETNSESVFSRLENIWVDGGWDGFKLDSQGTDGGLFWQLQLNQNYVINHMGRAYNFVSINQVSTTTTMRNCHTSCKTRDGVTHNGKSYLALQHMPSASPIEPGVTSGWEAYWEEETVFISSRPAWQSGVFYRTFGTGYLINNVQTVDLVTCSMDGGHNEVDGNVIWAQNSFLNIVGSFHLESHNMSKADGVSFVIGSDGSLDNIYMFDLRLRVGDGNNTYLIGGIASRNRNLHIENVRNASQAASPTGTLKYVNGGNDVTAFNSISCGSGVPPHLTFNMPDETHYDRPIKICTITGTGTVGDQTYSKGHKTVVVASASNPNYTAQREDSGALIETSATGVLTVTADRTVTPVGDSFKVVNRGVGTTAIAANGTGALIGTTTAASEKVITVSRVSDTIFLCEVSA